MADDVDMYDGSNSEENEDQTINDNAELEISSGPSTRRETRNKKQNLTIKIKLPQPTNVVDNSTINTRERRSTAAKRKRYGQSSDEEEFNAATKSDEEFEACLEEAEQLDPSPIREKKKSKKKSKKKKKTKTTDSFPSIGSDENEAYEGKHILKLIFSFLI